MSSTKWERLLVWTFRGRRFDDGEEGIDLRDLADLTRLRTVLVELAKDTWRRDHPARDRLPAHAEESLSLRIFSAEDGSCIVPIYFVPPVKGQTELFAADVDEHTIAAKLPIAAARLAHALAHIEATGSLPTSFPPQLAEPIAELGTSLGPEESFEVQVVAPQLPRLQFGEWLGVPMSELVDTEPVLVSAALRAQVHNAVAKAVSSVVDEVHAVAREQTLSGEIIMASLKGRAVLSLSDKREVSLEFDSQVEKEITRALHEHASMRVRVRGTAEFDAKGRVRKMKVEALRLVAENKETVEERFARLAASAPNEVIAEIRSGNLPTTSLTFAAEAIGKAC